MFLGILVSLVAGASFAAAGVLQQQAASSAPAEESLSPRLLGDLLRRRLWLAGIALAVLSYGWQALALSLAPLALVQPLIVTELLFAIPVTARLHRVRLHPRDWAGILAVATGLAVAVWGAAPHGNGDGAPLRRWAPALAVVVLVALAAVLLGRRMPGPWRAACFAVGAATLLSAGSGALTQFVKLLQDGGLVAGLASWAPYGLTVLSLGGLLLVQSAFQSGALAVVMPVMDTVEPLVAALLGVAVLNEGIDTSLGHLAALGIGACLLVGGIVALDTSPAVHDLQPGGQRGASSAGTAAQCRASRRAGTPVARAAMTRS